jgi:N-acetyl-1-D-myo-inositol-2-amino-2-deoxy-alpha-D-glucopyranoside deacetylase
MMGTSDNDDPDCFWRADLDEAAGHLVEVIREVRPQVLVAYDPDGGYGHPDHIQAHRVAMRAAELAAAAGESIAKVYWNRVPRTVVEEGFARLRDALPELPFAEVAAVGDVPGVVDDERITSAIDGTAYADAKIGAMRAHATQLEVAPEQPYFALSNELAQPLFTTEYYELVQSLVQSSVNSGRGGATESDLFEGLGL